MITALLLTPVILCRMYWLKKSIRWVNCLQYSPVLSHSVNTNAPPSVSLDTLCPWCVCVRACVCAEQPVHVVDAGSGLPPVRPASGGDPGTTSLSHHPSRPAAGYTGPAGGTSKKHLQNSTNRKIIPGAVEVVYNPSNSTCLTAIQFLSQKLYVELQK